MDAGDSTSQSNMRPGSVICDVCPGPAQRAVKTCLTCMASYCETHLQPHRVSEALKTHKLKEPIRNLHERICTRHQRVLEIFCRTDETCICSMCAATEHKSHDTVTPEEERAERQGDLENTKAEMRRRIEEKKNKLVEMSEKAERIRSTAETEVKDFEETFVSLLILWSVGLNLISAHENRELRKAEQLMMRLEKETRKLRRTHAELAELSETNDHIHFLQTFLSFCDHRRDGDIAADGDLLPETMGTRETVVKTPGCSQQNMTSRHEFLKYFSPLTLDPNTANRRLCLSKGNTRVTSAVKIVPYPDHPDRFDTCEQVLCREALSGTRCYWEVEWDGDEVDIGVTYKEINRKAETKECRLGFNDKSWSLTCSHFKCSVWHNKVETQFNVPSSHTFGVYLDCPAGSLSFYRVLPKMTFLNMILLHTFNASFSEPLYPGFGLGLDTSVTIRSP
ncbi:tripartite motif-containing protein 16-like [Erpetoichthys calabaricus]|uniref:tripartite motif-containing protein 16-like n=1 Tax=Erpetoichthys calabaricus TaxID=27687 RepID=UPI002233E74B|nr:tripartite motif-containing protein 16-like [Erpetoichthys calabaricus]